MSLRRTISSWLVCMVIVLSSAIAPRLAHSQLPDLRGTVTDSATRASVPGAVVMLMDAEGTVLARALSSERGAYRLLRPPQAAQLRVVRLGFSPITLPLTAATGRPEGGYQLDVRLLPFARALEGVAVAAPTARGCETRTDHVRSLALLEAARAGVLSAVVANEKDPPKLTMLRFERQLDGDGIEIVSHTVRVDSSPAASASFTAVHSAADFLANGFRSGREGDYTYYSPDAGVLLDERFPRGYCFDVAASSDSRRTQVGLHFTPASHRDGRIDIDGTVWIDTLSRALTEITFRYVGLDALAEGLGAGGRIGFRSLPSGATLIDQWQLRLISTPPPDVSLRNAVGAYQVREVGGGLAEARWADGRKWSAPLATVHISAVGTDNRPAPFARLRLAGSEYSATANADGRATILNVMPGPYRIAVDDPVLQPLGLSLPTSRTFMAVRGSAIVVRAEVGGPITVARAECERTDAPAPNESWVIGRMFNEAGRPIDAVRWQIFEADDGKWKPRNNPQIASGDGVFASCRGIPRGHTIEIVASLRNGEPVRVRRVLDAPLVAMAITVPTPVSVRASRASFAGSLTLSGVVTDSITGAAVADARVRLIGTPFEGATDERGQFVIGGLAAGRYTAEIGTAALDAFGLVGHRPIEVRDGAPPLALFAPQPAEARALACRGTGGKGATLVVGRVAPPGGNMAALSGYRVVAEWSEAASGGATRSGSERQSELPPTSFIRVVPDPTSGTFRICDAPADRPILISAEADDMHGGWAAKRVEWQRPDHLERTDLILDSTATAPTTWSGSVVADTSGQPVVGTAVVLTDLGVTLTTGSRGQFRVRELPTGPHLVSIKASGFQPWLGTIQIEPGGSLEQRILLIRTP